MALDPSFLSRPLAHRGLHDLRADAPENSPEAYRRAIAGGYGIELDVQISSDGRAMVFHDNDLDRMTERHGPVRQHTAADLGGIHLKGGSEGIPTLDEVLALVAGRTPLLVEIKDHNGARDPDPGALERAVVRDLSHYGGPVAVMSFNPNAIAHIHAANPDLTVGLTTTDFMRPFWNGIPTDLRVALSAMRDLDRVGASFISHDHTDLASSHVARARASGRAILCWTIRNSTEESRARKLADNITFEGYLARNHQ